MFFVVFLEIDCVDDFDDFGVDYEVWVFDCVDCC